MNYSSNCNSETPKRDCSRNFSLLLSRTIVIVLYTDASASYTRNRDNCKAADIFSLAPRCTQSPPRPSDLDTETSFFYRFFFLRALRVSHQRRNVICSPAGFLRNDRMNQIWRYINAPNYAAC